MESFIKKRPKAPWFIVLIWISLGVSAAYAASNQDWSAVFVSVATLILTFFMVRKAEESDYHIPRSLVFAAVVFVYATLFLGEVGNFYETYWWWDIVMHSGSALGFGLIGFIVLLLLFRSERVTISNPLIVAGFAFCFAMAIGAVWEIFEFAMDQAFGLNMQKSGLPDTMSDLIVDAVGGLVAAIAGYRYMSRRKPSVFSGVVDEAVKGNEHIVQ